MDVAQLDEPRSIGETLKGCKLGTFWKYRVGDCRIIASIEDGAMHILVVRIGNGRDVYHKSGAHIDDQAVSANAWQTPRG